MIKLDHTHAGKVCYVTMSRHDLTRQGLFQTIDPFTFQATTFACAYMPYTGHWYAWNSETGREIASFTEEFYELVIAPMRIADLAPDPECVT